MVVQNKHAVNDNPVMPPFPEDTEMAMFGMGCFWGAEKLFWDMQGVYSTQVGYAMGYTPNPMYREVCSEKTGHAEVVRIVYYPDVVNYVDLLTCFWQNHDPTMGMAQGNDRGTRYRSGVYYYTPLQKSLAEQSKELYGEQLTECNYKPITTEILPAGEFYYAEDYHQQYLHKNAGGYCGDGGTGIPCTLRLLKTPTLEGTSLKTQLSGDGTTDDGKNQAAGNRAVDNQAAGNRAVDNQAAGNRAVDNQAAVNRAVDNPAAGKRAVDNHAAVNRAVDNHAPGNRAAVNRAVDNHAPGNRAAVNRAVDNHAPGNCAAVNRAVDNHAPGNRAVDNHAPGNHAAVNRAVDNHAAVNRAVDNHAAVNRAVDNHAAVNRAVDNPAAGNHAAVNRAVDNHAAVNRAVDNHAPGNHAAGKERSRKQDDKNQDSKRAGLKREK
ncbi:hypothetical protein NP493_534g02038 [Ridgeia piscesae]|uniref:Mitochondrial peptide methionine sulfoxide reductase n=1 Tax=Ridgeia piscesae TaxID=27915 RepID=A0AAD9KXL0_RIDPI|nr:hypothetical protein NP493_534g02038 [Ridgeia piscesae]